MITLTYIGVGLLGLGWIVFFLIALFSESEYSTRHEQAVRSISKTHAHKISENVKFESTTS